MLEFAFYIKKFITFFVEPYGIFFILFSLVIYFINDKKYKVAKYFLRILFILMFLFAYPPFSNFLINSLEDRYSKYNYTQHIAIKYIHVLGNGHIEDDSQPLSSLISDAGAKRVIEGVIIHKNILNSKLIFTGYKNRTNISNALMNAKLAIALGVNKNYIIMNHKTKDTKEELMFIKSVLGSQHYILVTSATHMQRAINLSNSLGLNPIPAPTDFHKNKTSNYIQFPSISALEETRIAIHEYIGMVWNRLK